MPNPGKDFTKGIFLCFLSYSTWGLFPLYWKQLTFISADLLLAHRISWSFIFLMILILATKQMSIFKNLLNLKNILWLTLTGSLIGINWGTYIYSINTNQIVASSFGYYINPLVNIALGVVILKEKLNSYQKIAILFAILGVGIMSWHIGGIPLISLVLAFTFALYGLFRKMININSIAALSIETLILFPLALFWIFHSTQNQISDLKPLSIALLALGGVFTAVPLIWFGKATTLIPLSVVGFMQYLSPTLQLIIGITIYRESFSMFHFISFGLVWVGLIIFSYSMFSDYKKA